MPTINNNQFGGFALSSQASQTATMSTPATNAAGGISTPGNTSALTSAVKSTTGVSDFQAANRSFSKGGFGNTVAGIGHATLGTINALSTAAMVVPGAGQAVKGLSLGLNAGVKGIGAIRTAKAVEAVEAVKGVSPAVQASKGVNPAAHLNAKQFVPDTPTLYHGTDSPIKVGDVISPRAGRGNTPVQDRHLTFATIDAPVANKYSAAAAQAGPVEKGWSQPSMWGITYKVKPVNPAEMASTTAKYKTTGGQDLGVSMGRNVVSTSGFKVEGVHSFTPNPDLTKSFIAKPSAPKPSAPKPATQPHNEAEFVSKYGRKSGIS